MAIDFPASPTNGQTFTSGSVTYTWDGTKWTAVAAAGSSNSITQGNTNATVTDTGSDGRFVVTTEGSERARVDSSGRLLVGTTTATGGLLDVATSAGNGAFVAQFKNTNTANDGRGILNLVGNSSGDVNTLVFAGGRYFGTDSDTLAVINNAAGGGISFCVGGIANSTRNERMRITSDGDTFIGKTGFSSSTAGIELQKAGAVYATRDGSVCGLWNRLTSDGDIIIIQQASVTEGSISVSGTTVSYNGAHLSRWSQLPSGAERTEILRGSVLSNVDEMCEWGDEENEQLNRMKVSDVEGDKNVSGVFQGWDDDDDTYINDFYCAMTGDFIIRIGAGVTVERGDLLMSAGDGTAKPQDDDIIRSKTIAKVTSTNVSCTYEDGSYCVPCILMAC